MTSNPDEAGDNRDRLDEVTGFGESRLLCGECGSRLMYPASCTEHGAGHWYVELQRPRATE
jgi:hypothetical protein